MPGESPPTIGMILRQVRMGKGLTLRELERRGSIPHGYLGYIETGRRPPSLALVAQAARALDMRDEQVQTLLALAVHERFQRDVADYIRLQASLPRVGHTIMVSPDAAQAFIDGWQTVGEMSVHSPLDRGGRWRLALQDPSGEERAWWEFAPDTTEGRRYGEGDRQEAVEEDQRS